VKRETDVQIEEEESTPNLVKLSDGSYLQWDNKEGFFRVAYYQRSAKKGSDLEMTIAIAMKKPLHNSKVQNIFNYISKTDEYATFGS
jgi:hypothetical protein